MTKFKLLNGWTKETVRQRFRERNNGTQAVDEHGACSYRAVNNNQCFAGVFLNDDNYAPHLENKPASGIYGLFTDPPLGKNGMDLGQNLHDSKDWVNTMRVAYDNLGIILPSERPFTQGDTYAAIDYFLENFVE